MKYALVLKTTVLALICPKPVPVNIEQRVSVCLVSANDWVTSAGILTLNPSPGLGLGLVWWRQWVVGAKAIGSKSDGYKNFIGR